MKKIYINWSTLILLLLTITSCNDYFDQVPEKDMLSLEKIFETREGALKYLASVYTYLPDEFRQRNSANGVNTQGTSGAWVAGCDEAEFAWDFCETQQINNASYTPESGFVYDYWYKYYKGIRSATLFIENLYRCPNLSPGDYDQWTAEAKALRAIYYYYLFRLYGPVPILEEVISENASAESLQISRNSVEEVVNYIITQLQEAKREGLIDNIKLSKTLSSKYNGLGHIDRAIAQTFILQTRMLAASDLFNGSNSYYAGLTNKDGKKLFPAYSEEQKKQLWADAANDAKEFIDRYVGNGYDLCRIKTNGVLDPYLSYREAVRGYISEMLNVSSGSAAEMIFFRERVKASDIHYERTPKHFGLPSSVSASSSMAATQEMVDSYFMANGLKPINGYESDNKTPVINTASGYEDNGFSSSDYLDPVTKRIFAPKGALKAWVGREPRFYADITFDGQKWLNESDGVVYTSLQYSGNSGRGVGNSNDYSKTGYIVRKSAPLAEWDVSDRICILIRLAQIYLDYAEALNESDPGNPDILVYLNLIRERAGIPQYGNGNGQIPVPADMRQAIRDERRVELSFETQRYFDVRRWCIAEETESKAIHGMNINKDGNDFFVRTKVEDRIFEKKHYLFPLPQKDLNINRNLVQNTGWD